MVLLAFLVGYTPSSAIRNRCTWGAHLGFSPLRPYRFITKPLAARNQPRNWVSETHHTTRTGRTWITCSLSHCVEITL